MQIGTKVMYSRQWLKSTGNYTGDLPFARGTIIKIIDLGVTKLAEIDWNNDDIPKRVNINNLHEISKPEPE